MTAEPDLQPRNLGAREMRRRDRYADGEHRRQADHEEQQRQEGLLQPSADGVRPGHDDQGAGGLEPGTERHDDLIVGVALVDLDIAFDASDRLRDRGQCRIRLVLDEEQLAPVMIVHRHRVDVGQAVDERSRYRGKSGKLLQRQIVAQELLDRYSG